MSFSKFSKSIYKSLKSNGYKFIYIIFEVPNVNEITSYFGRL